MLKVTAKNAKNQTIQLTQSSSYQLVAISGIDPPVADIATAQLATDDGSEFNLARVPQRNIVLTIQPIGDVETTRTGLYPYFTPKSPVTLLIQTGGREVNIEGIVESFTVDYNANPQLIQVSIICPRPYFNAKNDTTVNITNVSATANNAGDVPVGFSIEVTLANTVSNFLVTNQTTSKTISFEDTPLQSGDVVKINTRTGQKSATFVHNGVESSLLPYMYLGSDWPTLISGSNSILISNGTAVLTFTAQYAGL